MFPTMPAVETTSIVKNVHRYGRGLSVGDIIVAKHPWYYSSGIGKRIIGMPGDYVVLDPPSASTANVTIGPTAGKMVQVPEGHCWLAGDNLPWSRDSRSFGPVPLGLVQGKILGVVSWRWPLPEYKETVNPLVEIEDDLDADQNEIERN